MVKEKVAKLRVDEDKKDDWLTRRSWNIDWDIGITCTKKKTSPAGYNRNEAVQHTVLQAASNASIRPGCTRILSAPGRTDTSFWLSAKHLDVSCVDKSFSPCLWKRRKRPHFDVLVRCCQPPPGPTPHHSPNSNRAIPWPLKPPPRPQQKPEWRTAAYYPSCRFWNLRTSNKTSNLKLPALTTTNVWCEWACSIFYLSTCIVQFAEVVLGAPTSVNGLGGNVYFVQLTSQYSGNSSSRVYDCNGDFVLVIFSCRFPHVFASDCEIRPEPKAGVITSWKCPRLAHCVLLEIWLLWYALQIYTSRGHILVARRWMTIQVRCLGCIEHGVSLQRKIHNGDGSCNVYHYTM